MVSELTFHNIFDQMGDFLKTESNNDGKSGRMNEKFRRIAEVAVIETSRGREGHSDPVMLT